MSLFIYSPDSKNVGQRLFKVDEKVKVVSFSVSGDFARWVFDTPFDDSNIGSMDAADFSGFIAQDNVIALGEIIGEECSVELQYNVQGGEFSLPVNWRINEWPSLLPFLDPDKLPPEGRSGTYNG